MRTISMRASLVVIPLSAACLYANGNESICAANDFRGTYAFHAQGSNVTNNAPITFAGSLNADGNGKITAWKEWAAVPASPVLPPNLKTVSPVLDRYEQARSLGTEILYTVEADCRISITAEFLGPTGVRSPLVWVGALASGGEEVLLMNGSAVSPYVSLVTVKRTGTFERRRREVASREVSGRP
jgi:hypothetical protein